MLPLTKPAIVRRASSCSRKVALPAFLLLGLVCGLVAVIFMRSIFFAEKVADRLQAATGLPRVLRPALAGLIRELGGTPCAAQIGRYLEAVRAQYAPYLEEARPGSRGLLELTAVFQAAWGSAARREVVLWQKVRSARAIAGLVSTQIPARHRPPGVPPQQAARGQHGAQGAVVVPMLAAVGRALGEEAAVVRHHRAAVDDLRHPVARCGDQPGGPPAAPFFYGF